MPDPLPLTYGLTPARPWRRVAVRSALAALLLVVAGEGLRPFAAPRWAAYQRQRQRDALIAQGLQFQRQCLAYTAPPDQLAYTNREPGREALSSDDRRFVPGAGAWMSMTFAWDQALATQGHPNPDHMGNAFLHERRAAGGGGPRLVAVDVANGQGEVAFLCSVVVPGRAEFTRPRPIHLAVLERFLDAGDAFRVYAGQPDPADPAAFTIRCTDATDEHGRSVVRDETIDGRLLPDDTVALRPRGTYMPDGPWELTLPNGRPLTPWNSPLRPLYGGGPQTLPATRRTVRP